MTLSTRAFAQIFCRRAHLPIELPLPFKSSCRILGCTIWFDAPVHFIFLTCHTPDSSNLTFLSMSIILFIYNPHVQYLPPLLMSWTYWHLPITLRGDYFNPALNVAFHLFYNAPKTMSQPFFYEVACLLWLKKRLQRFISAISGSFWTRYHFEIALRWVILPQLSISCMFRNSSFQSHDFSIPYLFGSISNPIFLPFIPTLFRIFKQTRTNKYKSL